MSSTRSNNAKKHLIRDLKQLQREPLIMANALPLENDIFKWYGIIVGAEGSLYAGVPIRFVLEFDENYPDSAPKAFFDTYIKYINGASYEVNGRLAVCLNIFGNFGHVHTEWKNQSEGWSPAYTVSTILIAMQGLMMSDMLSNNPDDIKRTIESAKKFVCSTTKHNGSDPNLWFPKVLLTQEDLEQYYKSNDIQVEKYTYDPLRDHYICYVKKTSFHDGALLGYGINIENQKIGTLSSPCEYISLEAFNSGIRRSSTNKPFSYWIPVLIKTDQWPAIRNLFVDNIKEIQKALNMRCDYVQAVVKTCTSIMNTLVVEIMNNKNNLQANDKFVNGYFAIFRLLLQFASEEPKVRLFVDGQLQKFIEAPDRRTKQFVPNLGELLMFLTISNKYSWNNIKRIFLNECDARNVFWYAVGNYNNPARHPELANVSVTTNRTTKVFNATEVSRNLVMFQVRFSEVTKTLSPELMDNNYGLAPDQLRNDLKDTYQQVIKVSDWNGYFKWLNIPEVSDQDRCSELIEAVKLSEKQGYHKRSY